jgi:hypothetical protein
MNMMLRQCLYLAASALCVPLLMGANNGIKESVAAGPTKSVASTVTNSSTAGIVGRTTGSVATSPSSSMASRATGSMATRPTPSMASRTTGSLASGVTSSMTGSRIKNGLATGTTGSIASLVTSSVTSTWAVLSPYAEELAKIIGFDRQVLILVKEITHERIGRLVGFDADGYQIIAPGIVVSVPEEKTDSILALLRRKLQPHHYMAFMAEMNAGIKTEKIGVLKGTDQYDILRIMHTNGNEYDISNQDVIDWLKEWEKRAPFDIVGADSDWVEIEFIALPADLKAFAQEVYDICPDAVDQGPGSVDGLVKEIRKTKHLFLWWD